MAKQGPLSGQQVAQKYLLGELLGSGGMGAVYKAWDTRLQRPIAFKVMSPASPVSEADLQQFTQLFQAEALRLASLKHSGIPHIYDHFEEAGRWFLVMEFIEGETLKDALDRRGGPLPVNEVLTIGLQLADVLDYLHQRQPPIIFRDLKPANVMLAPGGQVYLIDFGIARLFTPGKSQDTFLFLSPGYAAPEQHGTAQTTERSDIYSLGATLHHLLSGAHPASSPFLFAPLLIQQPAQLAPLIAQMVALDPATRPASMAAVKAALQGMRGQAARPSTPTDPVFFAPTQPTPPAPQSIPQAAAGCEIPLPDSRLCGIPPVGRCSTCGRAFCTTHQARDFTFIPQQVYIDMCASCLATAQAKREEQRRQRLTEENEARKYLQFGSARTALLAAREPTVEIILIPLPPDLSRKEIKRHGLFGRREEIIVPPAPVKRGWLLGEHYWEYMGYDDNLSKKFTEKCMTALLDLPPGGWKELGYTSGNYLAAYDNTVIRVGTNPRGYIQLYGWDKESPLSWAPIAQAAKRLAGEPS